MVMIIFIFVQSVIGSSDVFVDIVAAAVITRG
jgi:hypothetical protein